MSDQYTVSELHNLIYEYYILRARFLPDENVAIDHKWKRLPLGVFYYGDVEEPHKLSIGQIMNSTPEINEEGWRYLFHLQNSITSDPDFEHGGTSVRRRAVKYHLHVVGSLYGLSHQDRVSFYSEWKTPCPIDRNFRFNKNVLDTYIRRYYDMAREIELPPEKLLEIEIDLADHHRYSHWQDSEFIQRWTEHTNSNVFWTPRREIFNLTLEGKVSHG